MKKFLNKIIKEKNDRGFTIIETLVAVFILVLSITGPMVFAQSGLRTAFLARDQITAFYLAQDAIETIKNMRDNNALQNSNNWLDNILSVCVVQAGELCTVTINTILERNVIRPQLSVCSSVSCPPLMTDDNGRFGYNLTSRGASNSRFTRTVYLKEVVAGKQLEIVVEVKWKSNVGINESRIVVQENIFNWIPGQQDN